MISLAEIGFPSSPPFDAVPSDEGAAPLPFEVSAVSDPCAGPVDSLDLSGACCFAPAFCKSVLMSSIVLALFTFDAATNSQRERHHPRGVPLRLLDLPVP